MDKKLDIIPPPIKEDLEELFGYLWHLRNPIEAIRTGGVDGIGDYHDQLHVLNNSLNKLIIHIRNLLRDSDYLIDDLKQGFNINNLTKIDSGVHSLDSINQVDFPIVESSFLDLNETKRWSESQVENFKYFIDRDLSFARKLSQQFDINRTALEKYMERFRNDIAEHIKKFVVIPSTIQTSTDMLEKPKIPAGAKMENTQDKTKILIRNIYEEEKEKINQKADREMDKVTEDMLSLDMLYPSIHMNRLKKVEFDRMESLWKKRVEIEMHVRQEKVDGNTSKEIYDKASNIIEDEIEVAKGKLSKISRDCGTSYECVLQDLYKKKKEFLVAAKRRIDIEIAKVERALPPRRPLVSEREDFAHFLKTQFGYNKPNLSNKLKTVSDKKIRFIINKDIKTAVSCLMYELWKPCVILCGGVIEAILGDKISSNYSQDDIAQAYKKSYPAAKKLKKPEDYTLENFVDVAFQLGIIEKGIRDFAHGIRDYRNYIHPSKEANQKHSITQRDAIIACQTVFKILDEI